MDKEFVTIYEYSNNLFEYLMLPIVFISILIVSIWFILYLKKRPDLFFLSRRILIFFSFIFALFSSIFLVTLTIKLPTAIAKEKQISNTIRHDQYSIMEGRLANFSSEEVAGQHTDKFIIDDIEFTHSRFEKTSRPWKMKIELEPPLTNGKYYRIRFITIDSERIILKIESEQ